MAQEVPPAKLPRPGAEDPRKQRLAAALRDNLRRRKAQQRARDQEDRPRPDDNDGEP